MSKDEAIEILESMRGTGVDPVCLDAVLACLASDEETTAAAAWPRPRPLMSKPCSAGREFAKGLEVGDVEQLDFAEGLALSVEEV